MVPRAQRAEFFRTEVMERHLGMQMDAEDTEDFDGYWRGQSFGLIGLSVISGSPLSLRRTAELAMLRGGDTAYFDFMLNGELVVEQHGGESAARGYSCIVSDARRPYVNHLRSADGRPCMVTLSVPLHILPPRFSTRTWQPERHDLDIGAGRVLVDTLQSAISEINLLTASERASIGTLFVELLRSTATMPDTARAPTDARLLRVLECIERHFTSDALNGTFVARNTGMSERSLRRLLSDHRLSLTQVIREKRASEAVRRLQAPDMRHLSIAQVLLDCGFGDINTGGRALRSIYGLSPSAIRAGTWEPGSGGM